MEAVGIKNLCIKKNNIYLELYQVSTFICRVVAALELSKGMSKPLFKDFLFFSGRIYTCKVGGKPY